MIYLDNAATTKPCVEAINAFAKCAGEAFGNSSSLHSLGIKSDIIIEAAKKDILSRLPLNGELIFTSGATESNNLALFGAAQAYKRRGNKIISTAIEHPSVTNVLNKLSQNGFEVLKLKPGSNDFEADLINAVDEKTVLISAMTVNNETGFTIDTPKIYREVKKAFPNCVVHTDAVQGFLKVPADGDLISVSAHKIHGIKGSGGLYIKNGTRIIPQLYGGGQQENLRPGTLTTELVAAFAAAVNNYNFNKEYFTELSEYLIENLLKINGIELNSYNNISGIINFSVLNIRSEIMLHFLAENDIYVSSGSACSKKKKSEVLGAFGINPKNIDSAIRVSFSKENTTEDIIILIEKIKEAIKKFRK